jgi:hypothetical protein
MHYQSGIVLTANPPNDAWVWDTLSYITVVSDGPARTEFTFAPDSSFEVLAVARTTVLSKQIWSITLQLLIWLGLMSPDAVSYISLATWCSSMAVSFMQSVWGLSCFCASRFALMPCF